MNAGESPRIDVDPRSIQPEAVLSKQEIQLLCDKFASYNGANAAGHKARSLHADLAIQLFREDYPTLSHWEIQDMFHMCDLNFDGHLSLVEYLQTRAYYRLLLEASTEIDVQRSFAILDTDGDGIIRVTEVLALVEQSKLENMTVLQRAITQAAKATKLASAPQSRRRARAPVASHRDGEITLPYFASTIRDVNRRLEQEIAIKTLRVRELQHKLSPNSPHTAPAKNLSSKTLQMEVLLTEISRAKKELITGANQTLARVCEKLVATYANEKHVYDCLHSFVYYCGLHDATLFRQKLETFGKQVHVLDSFLMAPPEHLQHTAEYARMMDLTTSGTAELSERPQSARLHTYAVDRTSTGIDSPASCSEWVLSNPTARRQFAYYTMAGNVTNLETMTRSNFVRFVKDCGLHQVPGASLTDAEIANLFTVVCTCCRTMNVLQWARAIELLFERTAGNSPSQPELTRTGQFEAWTQQHVIAKARTISAQQLAPDISQSHVMKLLTEYIWRLKQIFSHFGRQSLVEVDSKVTVDLHEFLTFARAFGKKLSEMVLMDAVEVLIAFHPLEILRAPVEHDGEPVPVTSSAFCKSTLKPVSLMELMREFYAAKLDVSFANPLRRDEPDLNFREFLRCVLRIAVAMHAQDPSASDAQTKPPNGILTTSFEPLKEDDARDASPNRVHTPLYHRRGNVVAASPTKHCKMTNKSIIARLLRSSKVMALSGKQPNDQQEDLEGSESIGSQSRRDSPNGRSSPIKVVYGKIPPPSKPPETRSSVSTVYPSSPARPESSFQARRRPTSCGGPAVIRTIRKPGS